MGGEGRQVKQWHSWKIGEIRNGIKSKFKMAQRLVVRESSEPVPGWESGPYKRYVGFEIVQDNPRCQTKPGSANPSSFVTVHFKISPLSLRSLYI